MCTDTTVPGTECPRSARSASGCATRRPRSTRTRGRGTRSAFPGPRTRADTRRRHPVDVNRSRLPKSTRVIRSRGPAASRPRAEHTQAEPLERMRADPRDVRTRNGSAWLLPNDGTRTNHALRRDMRRFDPDEEVDLVVVGCGAGGGVLTQRLARRGWKVVALDA